MVNNSNRVFHKQIKDCMNRLAKIRQQYNLDPTPVSEEVRNKREEIIRSLEDDLRRLKAQL